MQRAHRWFEKDQLESGPTIFPAREQRARICIQCGSGGKGDTESEFRRKSNQVWGMNERIFILVPGLCSGYCHFLNGVDRRRRLGVEGDDECNV